MADRQENRSESPRAQRTSSENTLNGRQEENNNDNQKSEKQDDGGEEEKGEQGPPAPVGFFDKRLHSVRIEVAWKWVVTSTRIKF